VSQPSTHGVLRVNDPVFQITAVVALAVAASWLAARINIPSIVLLLTVGVVAGAGLRILDPDALAGDLLTPVVSMAVGLILFEGGLSLRFREIRDDQHVVFLLVTAGVAITWISGTAASIFFLDAPRGIAVLLGAILVVSGPTVVGPILRSVQPSRSVASILKWESILIDPVGAMLAVVTFEVVLVGATTSTSDVFREAGMFVLAGLVAGLLVAFPTGWSIERHLIPERLVPLVGIAAALIAFALADLVASESGLLATTVLGLVLANNPRWRVEPLIHFSGIVQTLLVGVVFILLSARLTRDQLTDISVGVIGLVVILVLVARPLSVAVSTIRSTLKVRERVFVAAVAPRGIVAAAVASVFALELEEAAVDGNDLLTPVTFAVVVVTVLLYGLGAGPLARRLGLAEPSREGALIVGAGPVEREIGRALTDAGIPVLFASTNRRDETAARMAGNRTYYGNLIEKEVPWDLDLSGIGRLLAVTPNDEVNTLAARRFAEVFGQGDTYQLAATPAGPGIEGSVADIGGRTLFDRDLTYDELRRRLDEGTGIRRTTLSDEFTIEDLAEASTGGAKVLFAISGDRLLVGAADASRPLADRVQPGDTVLWIPGPGAV
jgi:NhaP-type Na+/H+ or K+/H+ antiporter